MHGRLHHEGSFLVKGRLWPVSPSSFTRETAKRQEDNIHE
jgi:hypothetical protein